MKDLLHIQKKSHAFILNFKSETININILTSRGRAVQSRGAVFLHHFTPRTAHEKSHNLRLLGAFPPLNSLDFFILGNIKMLGQQKKKSLKLFQRLL